MATEHNTIARPYAQAAFEHADQHNQLAAWESFLLNCAQVCLDAQVVTLLNDPRVTAEQLFDFFSGVCGSFIDEKQRNFLHVLAEYKRLAVLPEIATLFAAARAEKEKIVSVEVLSSLPLSDAELDKLKAALKNRLQREVTIECSIDENLLGGAVIRAGDMVIDGSIRTKLKELRDAIAA